MDKDLLYRKEILDYYKNPMFKEKPSSYDLKARLKNPSCGDDLTIYISLDKEHKKFMLIALILKILILLISWIL